MVFSKYQMAMKNAAFAVHCQRLKSRPATPKMEPAMHQHERKIQPSHRLASQEASFNRRVPAAKMSGRHDVHRIPIDDIVVREGRRAIDLEAVAAIADSMAEIGQRMPITVRARKGRDSAGSALVLVVGRHRLEAAKMLRWKRIDAVYLDGDKSDARLWEIAENLHR